MNLLSLHSVLVYMHHTHYQRHFQVYIALHTHSFVCHCGVQENLNCAWLHRKNCAGKIGRKNWTPPSECVQRLLLFVLGAYCWPDTEEKQSAAFTFLQSHTF